MSEESPRQLAAHVVLFLAIIVMCMGGALLLFLLREQAAVPPPDTPARYLAPSDPAENPPASFSEPRVEETDLVP